MFSFSFYCAYALYYTIHSHLPLETCAPISIAGRDDVPRWIRLCQYELLWNPRLFGD